jgi:hypothetical protein
MSELLVSLQLGDRLPWRLDADGEPQWLIVVEVVTQSEYVVEYPDGTRESLVDAL